VTQSSFCDIFIFVCDILIITYETFIFVCDILIIIYDILITRKNCFRYLKLVSSLNAAICTTISYTL